MARAIPKRQQTPFQGVRSARAQLSRREGFHRHRFLRSSHLAALDGGSHQQVLRRLRHLFDHGYVDRVRTTMSFVAGQANKPLVYALGRRGAATLAAVDHSDVGRLDWTAKNKEAGLVFIEHTLMIAEIMVGFELACRDHPRVRLIDEDEVISTMPAATRRARQPLRWQVDIALPGQRPSARVGLAPDRAFALAIDEALRANFLLEADRGTMRVPEPAVEPSVIGDPLITAGGIVLTTTANLFLAYVVWHYRNIIAARLNRAAPWVSQFLRSF